MPNQPQQEQESPTTPFDLLCKKLDQDFPAIKNARKCARVEIKKLTQIAEGRNIKQQPPVSSQDTSIVIYGSLARLEWTNGGDVDWTLLVDGQVDPNNQRVVQEFRNRLDDDNYKEPGPEAVFGGMSFSHELVHWIGGQQDSNTNMTRRLLLLLESIPLTKDDVHTRVIRAIFDRYIYNERSFVGKTKDKVPRFLLNDIVRYWRTLAVDYVSKRWVRGDKGWALRNIKLRFSRKLLFVSGLLWCFSYALDQHQNDEPTRLEDEDAVRQKVRGYIVKKRSPKPLDVLCDVLLKYAENSTSIKILEAYDGFLKALNTEDREKLKELNTDSRSYSNPIFKNLVNLSHEFQSGLDELFYKNGSYLSELIKKYGVF